MTFVGQPRGSNPLGEVMDRTLVLVGEVAQGTLIAPSVRDFYYHLKLGGPTSIEVPPDTILVEDAGTQPGRTVRRAKEGELYQPFIAPVSRLALMATEDDCVYDSVLGCSPRVKGAF